MNTSERFTRNSARLQPDGKATRFRQQNTSPELTTAHCPLGGDNNYWPEMYYNMPIVDAQRPHPYGDTVDSQKRFGAVVLSIPKIFPARR